MVPGFIFLVHARRTGTQHGFYPLLVTSFVVSLTLGVAVPYFAHAGDRVGYFEIPIHVLTSSVITLFLLALVLYIWHFRIRLMIASAIGVLFAIAMLPIAIPIAEPALVTLCNIEMRP